MTSILRRLCLWGMLACLCFPVSGTTIQERIYINSDSLVTVDTTKMAALAFNWNLTFNAENARLIIETGDTLQLTVVNNDINPHGINIKGYAGVNQNIPAGDSTTITCSFSTPSVHIYYDPTNAPGNRYLGLGGMLVVKAKGEQTSDFFWNIKEHQSAWNNQLAAGGSVNWADYYPNYFTINGRSNPHINNDTNARITGSVGDTIHIYLVNTGQAAHSLHFHGYHANILYASDKPQFVGRSKDTFPVRSMEGMILELVPDQTGEYPVHDHNLVAVSGGNLYPNGMFTTILIQ